MHLRPQRKSSLIHRHDLKSNNKGKGRKGGQATNKDRRQKKVSKRQRDSDDDESVQSDEDFDMPVSSAAPDPPGAGPSCRSTRATRTRATYNENLSMTDSEAGREESDDEFQVPVVIHNARAQRGTSPLRRLPRPVRVSSTKALGDTSSEADKLREVSRVSFGFDTGDQDSIVPAKKPLPEASTEESSSPEVITTGTHLSSIGRQPGVRLGLNHLFDWAAQSKHDCARRLHRLLGRVVVPAPVAPSFDLAVEFGGPRTQQIQPLSMRPGITRMQQQLDASATYVADDERSD